mmetsp:Transcript_24827/g.72730  ORF Transcript_24827/g.72730 Transcript_24827/m.72730 type:complete len:397 (-) Transcript_24827:379-1569(-)
MKILALGPAFVAMTMILLSSPVAASTSSALRALARRHVARAAFSSAVHQVPATLVGRSTFLLKSATALKSSADSGEEVADNGDIDWEPFKNEANRRDQVFSAISGDGGIKVSACTVRNIVNDEMIMHSMTAVPADALGRVLACSVLISNGMQDEQVFQITVDGDGPLRGIVAISSGLGEVRGYVGNPGIGEMPLQEAVGKGVLKVVKNHPSWPNPYNGIAAIRSSDIDRDVGGYLAESEQRSCALAASTSVTGILCKAAGGYLVEKLPECSDETMKKVEDNLAVLVEKDGGDKLPTNLLLNGVTPLEIAEIILDGLDMKPLQQIEPKAKCECSEERLFRSLRLLPREEVDDILEKEEQIEARCQFCGKVYRMGPEEVRERYAKAKGDPTKDAEVDA